VCDELIRVRYRLYDKAGEAVGDYHSRECAESDAWGPRFRPFKVRKLARRKAGGK
jgi:hypothetical protein